jgi:uncharacterized protein YjbI with pentapeptide repeats
VLNSAPDMANPEHVAKLKEGVEKWNSWIWAGNGLIVPDFRGLELVNADLRWMDLEKADFTSANLLSADLFGANLRGASFVNAHLELTRIEQADLRGGILTDAHLERAIMSGSDLASATLTRALLLGASLNGVNFSGARLYDADFSKAQLDFTDFTSAGFWRTNLQDCICAWSNFSNVDLRQARNLASVQHRGPSTIGIDTIYKSEGDIPELFLRGCGVPDAFIAFIQALISANHPIQFYSCFISYSTRDQTFADRLYADLQAKGVRCWFAPHDIVGGRKIHEQIDQAISVHEKLLLILSPHSMQSNWVKTEIANARAREHLEGKQMLFPVTLVSFDDIRAWKLFDADTGIDSALEIREYFIPDFSHWEASHAEYQNAFGQLLAGLKAKS